MNNNTFLYRVGLNPKNFIDQDIEPIKTDDGLLYLIEERKDIRICPYCNNINKNEIKKYYNKIINVSTNTNMKETIQIKRVQFICKNCKKTFTNELEGIENHNTISEFIKNQIIHDFRQKLTFKQIAEKYHISIGMTIKLFDEQVTITPTGHLPKVLCIDEYHFETSKDSKYICVLIDYETRTVFDIIQSRQKAYLEEYFNKFNSKELERIKYFCSDLYDEYAHIKRKYFPKAIHIADKFHVIKQMTTIVNMLRTRVMNKIVEYKSKEYNFMKKNWKLFLKRKEDIPNKTYYHQTTGIETSYEDLVFNCIKLNEHFSKSYNVLQDLYKYSNKTTYTEATEFIRFIYERLRLSTLDELVKVGNTFYKWRHEIANSFARNATGYNISNGIAENMNNHIATIIKIAYGYSNYERFRKRVLLICKYNKNWI